MTSKSKLHTVLKRGTFSLIIIFIYILGSHIPLPFVEITTRYKDLVTNTPLSVMSVMSGASLSSLSIFSVGLSPFMIAVLVLQIFTMTKLLGFDALSTAQIQNFQQVLVLILAIIQSIVFTFGLTLSQNLAKDLTLILLLTAGSMLVFWLCTINIKFGIGGTAPIILVNIITSIVTSTLGTINDIKDDQYFWLYMIGILLVSLIAMFFWISFSHAYYPLKAINTTLPSYSKPILIPIGLNMGAMMTYMIGMGLLMLPTMLTQYFSPDSIVNNIYFDAGVSFVLTFVLFYFFSFMQFDPKEQAKNMRNSNSYILNVRPGLPTQKYLTKLIISISFPGALLNALIITFGLLGTRIFGKYAGLAMILLNLVMITLFITSINDQIRTLLYPYKYEQLEKED